MLLMEFFANVLRLRLAVLNPVCVPIGSVEAARSAFADLFLAADKLKTVSLMSSPARSRHFMPFTDTALERFRLPDADQVMKPGIKYC